MRYQSTPEKKNLMVTLSLQTPATLFAMKTG